MNRFITPSHERMAREWIKYYNSQEDKFKWKFAELYKFVCDLHDWWIRKQFFSYKQEQAIDKIYHRFNLHLTYANGYDLCMPTVTRKMA